MPPPGSPSLAALGAAIAALELEPAAAVEAALPSVSRDGVERWPVGSIAQRPASGAWVERWAVADGAERRLCVKDLIDVAGVPTRAGTVGWSRVAAVDAPAVAALRAAGGAVVGKGHTVEFAYGIDGLNPHLPPCPNPWDPARLPGGSSSGPAVAVACGEADVGLGTDTSGSIRTPAALCGLLGLRPTHGLVSVTGVVPLSPSLDVVSPLARDLAGLEWAFEALVAGGVGPGAGAGASGREAEAGAGAGAGDRDRSAASRAARRDVDDLQSFARGAVRVGVVVGGPPPPSALAAAAVARAAALLRDAGAELVGVELPCWPSGAAAQRVVQFAEAAAVHAEDAFPGARYSPQVRDRLAAGAALLAAAGDPRGPALLGRLGAAAAPLASDALARGRAAADAFRRRLLDLLTDVDVLLLPAANGVAPRADADPQQTRETLLGPVAALGLTGGPVLSVPIARSAGLPLGVQLAAAPHRDRALLALAHHLHARRGQS